MPKITELPVNSTPLTGSELVAVVQNGSTCSTTLLQIAQTIPAWSSVAGTITIGTVTTGAAGSSATISNVGTPSAAVLNFSIPMGNIGLTGPQGIQGIQGAQGIQGLPGRVSIMGRWV